MATEEDFENAVIAGFELSGSVDDQASSGSYCGGFTLAGIGET